MISTVTVFGAGLMGAGIAQTCAQAGLNVVLCDVSHDALANGRRIIATSLSRVASKLKKDASWIEEVLSRVSEQLDPAEAVLSSDLVIEAIIENLEIKRKLFKTLDAAAPPHCIFTSNTSSLPVGAMAEAVSSSRKARFGALHFFNPVPAMKLVEVISTDQTSPETTKALFDFCKRIGKVGVPCKDTPGFIVNRLLVPYMLEAIRLVERGDASVEAIDTAMKLGAGFPMGPLELLDLIGLDTVSHISSGWRELNAQNPSSGIDDGLVKPIKLLEDVVREGRFGRKTKKGGFWEYDAKGKKRARESKL